MQFKQNAPVQKKSRRKGLLIISVVILLALGGGFAFMQTRNTKQATKEPNSQKTDSDKSVGDVPTYEAETEGQTVDVPTNVDPNSIKNYELITENEQFKIRKLDNQYTITLYAIINSPDQSSTYRDQLKEYKQNALNFLSQKGINTSTASITYDPPEASTL